MNTLDCAWPGIVFAPICHGYVVCIYFYRPLRICVGLWKALARMVSWNTRSWNVATDFGSRFAKKSTRDPKSVHNFDVSIWWSRWALRPLEIRVDFFSILWRTRISKKIGRSVNSFLCMSRCRDLDRGADSSQLKMQECELAICGSVCPWLTHSVAVVALFLALKHRIM